MIQNYLKYILTLILGLVGLQNIVAQAPVVKAYLDSTYVYIGSPTTIHLEATHKVGEKLLFPEVLPGIAVQDDTLQYSLTVYDVPVTDTLGFSGDRVTVRQDVLAYAYDSASLFIPPFAFLTAEGDTLHTNSLALKVVVPFDVEVDPQKFCDIKDFYTPDFVIWDYAEWVLWPLFVILLVVGAIFLWRYLEERKLRKAADYVAPVEVREPHVVAMEALEALGEKKLWQNGFHKQYYTELTDILRLYIHGRFGIPAMEQTSEQILASLRGVDDVSKSCMQNLRQIFSESDLVKFAKYLPIADDNELSYMNAKMFVSQTIEVKSIDTSAALQGEEETVTQ